MTVEIAAADDTGVSRVEVLEDGVIRHTLTAAPYRLTCGTTTLADGKHTIQARAHDAAGNVGVSTIHAVEVRNNLTPVAADGDIVLYAHRAKTIAGTWRVSHDATAAPRLSSLRTQNPAFGGSVRAAGANNWPADG